MGENYFQRLNGINVNDKTEKKHGLTYLSWAWAWGEVKKLFPEATYTIYENANGLFYHTDGRTAWVKTGVTVEGIEHIEYLPVLDYRNTSIPLEKLTSFDVNKAIQRSLTKALARHGLGLYIYAGEDLPEAEKTLPSPTPEQPEPSPTPEQPEPPATRQFEHVSVLCERCKKQIQGVSRNGQQIRTPSEIIKRSHDKYNGHNYCYFCMLTMENEKSNQSEAN